MRTSTLANGVDITKITKMNSAIDALQQQVCGHPIGRVICYVTILICCILLPQFLQTENDLSTVSAQLKSQFTQEQENHHPVAS